MNRREKLIELIGAAFFDAKYPNDDNIGRYEVRHFIGKHWREVSIEQIQYVVFDLAMFSPEGFRYFLPGLLIHILSHPDPGDPLPDNIIWMLSPPKPDDGFTTWFAKMVSEFTPQQREAVNAFVSSYKELNPSRVWSRMQSERERLELAMDFWSKKGDS